MRVAKARKFIKDAPNSHVYEGRNFVLPKRALFSLLYWECLYLFPSVVKWAITSW